MEKEEEEEKKMGLVEKEKEEEEEEEEKEEEEKEEEEGLVALLAQPASLLTLEETIIVMDLSSAHSRATTHQSVDVTGDTASLYLGLASLSGRQKKKRSLLTCLPYLYPLSSRKLTGRATLKTSSACGLRSPECGPVLTGSGGPPGPAVGETASAQMATPKAESA